VTDKWKKMRACVDLLPDPAPAVVIECLDEIERLRAENFILAAGQCVSATADEGGRPYCKEVIALRAERDALRMDAERYRWLRAHEVFENENGELSIMFHCNFENFNNVDAAIDAARSTK